MRTFASPTQFAEYLERAALRQPEAQRDGLRAAGELVAAKAKGLIGTEADIWAALAEATVAEKTRLGFTGKVSATDPLLRTGELRDSIGYQVRGDHTVAVGSADPIAAYQELGTVRIPARPFLSTAMFREAVHAVNTVVRHIGGTVTGRAVSL